MLSLILIIFVMIASGATAGERWEVVAAAVCVAALLLLLALITGRPLGHAVVSFAITCAFALGVGFVTYLIRKTLGGRSGPLRRRKDMFGRKIDSKADVFD